jgi:maltose alpha-D-glucosyltransferase/alpha-amylase
MEELVHCEAMAMEYFVDQFRLFMDRAMVHPVPKRIAMGMIDLGAEPSDEIKSYFGTPLEYARLLGSRTSDLHRTLAGVPEADFAPEPFTDFYRQSLYHGLLGTLGRTMDSLRQNSGLLPEEARSAAQQLLASENVLRSVLKPLRETRIFCNRIRLHGDLHLDQVLFTGKDFVFVDFEGDPSRPASERRIKAASARDLATMLWSFHYAANAVFHRDPGSLAGVLERPETRERVQAWAELWGHWMANEFVRSYVKCSAGAGLLPPEEDKSKLLLECYLIDRACRELQYNLVQSSPWVTVPLQGLLQLVHTRAVPQGVLV